MLKSMATVESTFLSFLNQSRPRLAEDYNQFKIYYKITWSVYLVSLRVHKFLVTYKQNKTKQKQER